MRLMNFENGFHLYVDGNEFVLDNDKEWFDPNQCELDHKAEGYFDQLSKIESWIDSYECVFQKAVEQLKALTYLAPKGQEALEAFESFHKQNIKECWDSWGNNLTWEDLKEQWEIEQTQKGLMGSL